MYEWGQRAAGDHTLETTQAPHFLLLARASAVLGRSHVMGAMSSELNEPAE